MSDCFVVCDAPPGIRATPLFHLRWGRVIPAADTRSEHFRRAAGSQSRKAGFGASAPAFGVLNAFRAAALIGVVPRARSLKSGFQHASVHAASAHGRHRGRQTGLWSRQTMALGHRVGVYFLVSCIARLSMHFDQCAITGARAAQVWRERQGRRPAMSAARRVSVRAGERRRFALALGRAACLCLTL